MAQLPQVPQSFELSQAPPPEDDELDDEDDDEDACPLLDELDEAVVVTEGGEVPV
jgi:hypothetical protein